MASKSLPQQLKWEDADNKWAAMINPFLKNPCNASSVLKGIPLIAGTNVINHLLGAPLQGWNITRMRGVSAAIYDTQDTNITPQLTLVLVASAPVIVDIQVF